MSVDNNACPDENQIQETEASQSVLVNGQEKEQQEIQGDVLLQMCVARLRFFSDSDFFQPLFWGLIYCFSDIFLNLMLKHTRDCILSIFVWFCCF